MVTIPNQDETIVKKLMEVGFHKSETKTQYEKARLISISPKATAILYSSGKLLIQTSSDNETKILIKLGLKAESKKKDASAIRVIKGSAIGSDETLKGDTFGGLVVVGVHCNDELRQKLRMSGVDDSKNITDEKIPRLSKDIKRIVGEENISIKNVYPEIYNKNSQTKLMNDLHRQVFLELNKDNAVHIVDKYPGCNVGDIKETKAESKYVEVAAASIIAREEGLKQLALLSEELGIGIPKGSTHVKHALEFLKGSKKDPRKFVKMHFKNVQKFFK